MGECAPLLRVDGLGSTGEERQQGALYEISIVGFEICQYSSSWRVWVKQCLQAVFPRRDAVSTDVSIAASVSRGRPHARIPSRRARATFEAEQRLRADNDSNKANC